MRDQGGAITKKVKPGLIFFGFITDTKDAEPLLTPTSKAVCATMEMKQWASAFFMRIENGMPMALHSNAVG